MPRATIESLIETGSSLVQDYAEAGDERTDILRRLAAVVYQIRSRFKDSEGNRDWAGRTHDYRMTIARMYVDAAVPAEVVGAVQAALRYHVGNYLRDHLDAEELERVGLLAASPKERIQSARAELSAMTDAFRVSRAGDDCLKLLTAALQCVERVEAQVDTLDAETLGAAQSLAADVAARAKDLDAHLKKAMRSTRA